MQHRTYYFDRGISDKRMELVTATLGRACFRVSSYQEDVFNATDLVPSLVVPRCAVRVRNHSASKYAGEITMRFKRSTGCRTEFEKIHGGEASHMFYAIMGPDETAFYWWVLVDLNIFRRVISGKPELLESFDVITNTDGRSSFVVIPLCLVPECVVHSSVYLNKITNGKAMRELMLT